MIGILDCRSQDPGRTWAGTPPEMLEFFDRPLLQHAVEQMVQVGVTHCVLITEDTSAVMQRWGEGERWGCTFSAIPPQAVVSFLVSLSETSVMIGRGDSIPSLTGALPLEVSHASTHLVFRRWQNNGTQQSTFTGWAVTNPRTLLDRCFATYGANGLLSLQDAIAIQVDTCICSDTPMAFLRSQEIVLEAVDSAVIFHGMQIRPGVWAARNVTLHPTTRIIGKVYLGENVRIGPHVTLVGPVVICRDCAIDVHSVLADTSVQPGTYLGRSMSLQHDVVIEDTVIRAGRGIAVKVKEPGCISRTDTTLWSFMKAIFASTA